MLDKEYCMRQVALCDKWIAYDRNEIEKAKAKLVGVTDLAAVEVIVKRVVETITNITNWEKSRENWLYLADKANKNNSK